MRGETRTVPIEWAFESQAWEVPIVTVGRQAKHYGVVARRLNPEPVPELSVWAEVVGHGHRFEGPLVRDPVLLRPSKECA